MVPNRKHFVARVTVSVSDIVGGPTGPVSGVPVVATWYVNGSSIGTSSGTTDGNGQVTLQSPKNKASSVYSVEVSGGSGWILTGEPISASQ